MTGTSGSAPGRAVAGSVDAESSYGSAVASAGGYVFFAETATDKTGGIAADATPPEPYQGSAAAQAEAQGRWIFERLAGQLAEVGSSVADIVQVEQYVKLKVHADPYFRVATSKDFLGQAVPVAATAQVGSYAPDGAVVAVTGLAIVPDEASGLVKASPDDAGGATSASRKFSELITAGPYIFTTIFPSDRKSGLPEEARTPSWIWSGSEIGAEMKWGLAELDRRLASVGAGLSDIVDYTLFLTDVGDLYEFDTALRAVVGDDAPSRTVIPSRGFALPRREGAFGHEEGAPRMEAQFRIRRPDAGLDKQSIDGPGSGFGYQSAGVRLGPLAWLSSQVADRTQRSGDVRREIDAVFEKLALVCTSAGTDLSKLLRVRALLTRSEDAAAFAAALREHIPVDPPAVCIAVVPGPLPVADASVAIDAVAHVSG